jgi:glutamate-1-semialdehyde 2,1-aminomutase
MIFCMGKALGNGYPISVALGREELRGAASRVFLTGTYWNNAVPMAAALACLRVYLRDQVLGQLYEMGKRFCDGLERVAAAQGLRLRCSGPPSMPFATFEGDDSFCLQQEFCVKAAEEGVFLHPHHNWFLCSEHGEEEIAGALERVERALGKLREVVQGSANQEGRTVDG